VEFCRDKTVNEASSGRCIAVVAAHADDEVLGCGGTVRRHVLAGDQVWHIILADGETSRGPVASVNVIARRENAARAAADRLGVQHLEMHRFPDNRLDACPLLDIVTVVERHIAEIRPAVLYTHHAGDLNIDHRRVHEAVVTACRPQPRHPVRRLLFFETPSSTEWQPPSSAMPFAPNWFVDISGTLADKVAALRAYDGEMRAWPHPRSYEAVEHLARWRGATVGCEAAEAFILGRGIS
jgi:LmbE family N-acetylglucosaminyl deacetylase